jgi:microcystin-dependent protein
MESSFIGEIRAFAFGFYPRGWLPCDGRTVLITQYQVLFAVISNIYGGNLKDGTFNLPNIRCLVPLGTVKETEINKKGGNQNISLEKTEIPAHKHFIKAIGVTGVNISNLDETPSSNVFLSNNISTAPSIKGVANYSDARPLSNTSLNLRSVSSNPGGIGSPHENRMPYLAMNYCICVNDGEYPLRG